MKRFFLLTIALLIFLCACSPEPKGELLKTEDIEYFVETENGNLISNTGVEYVHLANEGFLVYFGEKVFLAGVQGEEETSQHLLYSYQTGMFALEHDNTYNVLIRREPDNEWASIYRKASLPPLDFNIDRCSRLEYISQPYPNIYDETHTTCGDGITGKAEIAEFLADIRSQANPRDAGLYDRCTKPDGFFENVYGCGVIFAFFGEEPNVAVPMYVTSFNDLGYSVEIDGEEYVLPEEWIHRLRGE